MDTNERDREKRVILEQALNPDRACFLDATTKETALRAMIEVLATSDRVQDRAALADAVFKREDIMSTGIGLGLAVPHVRIASVSKLVMAIGISRPGISDYVSLDDLPVHVVFLIAAPEGQHFEYLKLLAAISSRAKVLNGQLLECSDESALYELLVNADSACGASSRVGA